MKKTLKLYALIWLLALAVFNVIVFVSPTSMEGYNKFYGAFWSGYIFIMIGFVGQLACVYWAFRTEKLQNLVYRFPMISISYTGLVVMLLVGTACMLIPDLPNWVGIIVCGLILVVNIVAILKTSIASGAVEKIDESIGLKTLFVRSLSLEAEVLMERAASEELKAVCKKVYEAARYSDPMSHALLVETEEKLEKEFASFVKAVETNDEELAVAISVEVLALISTRNKKCKLLK